METTGDFKIDCTPITGDMIDLSAFARVGDEARKRVRYILGVPGHYYSSEKYMASMFGFPHFVLAKKQPVQNGRFGYWYADVSMENTD